MRDFDDLPMFPKARGLPDLSGPMKYARRRRDDGDDDDGDNDDRSDRKSKNTGLSAVMVALIAFGVVGCCLILPVGAVLVALFVPAVQKVREAAARTQSVNNLKQIGLAFHSFHAMHKRLPFNGANAGNYKATAVGGSPMSGSWGFQILPFMDRQAMFQAVDRNQGIPAYLCPGRGRPPIEAGGGTWTDYFINAYVNDPLQAANPGAPDMKRTLAGITDGTSNTVIVGHGNIRMDQYTSSANVTFSTNIFTGGTTGTMRGGNPGAANPGGVMLRRDSFNPPSIGSWGGPFPQGGVMALGDGSVRTFPYTMGNFNAFLTPTGNEPVQLPD